MKREMLIKDEQRELANGVTARLDRCQKIVAGARQILDNLDPNQVEIIKWNKELIESYEKAIKTLKLIKQSYEERNTN